MKGKCKRWMSVVVTMAMLCVMPRTVFSAQDETVVEWTYDDSIHVNVMVDESRTFSPEDFPGIDCKKVFIMGKSQLEQGFRYELVLLLDVSNNTDLEKTIEKVQQLPMVDSAMRNRKYAPAKAILALDRLCIYLAAEEESYISVDKYETQGVAYSESKGICFTPNPTYFSPESIQKDSFLSYGISRFWPEIEGTGYTILSPLSRPNGLEGKKSESGIYYGLAGEYNENLMSTVAAMVEAPEFLEVFIVKEPLIGTVSTSEYWQMENTDIASVRIVEGLSNRTAIIQGLSSGVTTLVARRGVARADCTVIVYEPGSKNNPGDLDHNGEVDAKDALQVLKNSVKLISLDEADTEIADLNQDNVVDVDDALLMLKIAVGIL